LKPNTLKQASLSLKPGVLFKLKNKHLVITNPKHHKSKRSRRTGFLFIVYNINKGIFCPFFIYQENFSALDFLITK